MIAIYDVIVDYLIFNGKALSLKNFVLTTCLY